MLLPLSSTWEVLCYVVHTAPDLCAVFAGSLTKPGMYPCNTRYDLDKKRYDNQYAPPSWHLLKIRREPVDPMVFERIFRNWPRSRKIRVNFRVELCDSRELMNTNTGRLPKTDSDVGIHNEYIPGLNFSPC